MFKFSIGNKSPEFGDSYFPCPKCLGQTVLTEKGGRCWDCNTTFRVEFTDGPSLRQKIPVRPELIVLGVVGITLFITYRHSDRR